MPEELPFNRPSMVGNELQYIAQAVEDGHISGDGQFTRRCEAWLEREFGTARALLTHSCTGALEMAALLSGVGPGDEVILPSWTFVTTASAFAERGATLVFVDVREDTLNIDEALVAQAITRKTRAIVCVHYAGVPCDMVRLQTMAHDAKALLVEDAAQAFHSRHAGKFAGTIADLGCLSFHETKNIISGEGGALLVNRPDLIERAEIVREKGTNRRAFFRGAVDKYTWVELGSSFLPNELTAAFLYAQMEHAHSITQRRRYLVARYGAQLAQLAHVGHVTLPKVELAEVANGHMMYCRVADLATRTRLLQFMRERCIGAVFHYIPLHSSPAGLRYGRATSTMPVTNAIADTLIRLPLYFRMSDVEQDRVLAALYQFFGIDYRYTEKDFL